MSENMRLANHLLMIFRIQVISGVEGLLSCFS